MDDINIHCIQTWDDCKVAKKVRKFKAKLRDPEGKQRAEVTKLISKEKSGQEFVLPLGKYVDLAKAEPLHNTNNACSSGFQLSWQWPCSTLTKLNSTQQQWF